jgi:hypothetical protein
MEKIEMKTNAFILITLILGSSVFAQEAGKLITVSLNAPNPGYSIKIQSVYQNHQSTFIYAYIIQPDPEMNYAAVITNIKDSVRIPKETDVVKVYITGKDWNWSDENDYIFVEDKQEFEEITKGLIQIKSLK